MTTVLRVKKWEDHQHYRDRDPVWIKVYGRLLDDADFLGLPEAAQAQLVKLWLVASRCRNTIRDDATYLRHALHTTKLHVELLVAAGFIERVPVEQSASKVASIALAKPERNASPHARPRARGETETESETETPSPPPRARGSEKGDDPFWSDDRVTAFLDAIPAGKHTAWRAILAGWRSGDRRIGATRPTDDQIADGLVAAITARDEGPLGEAFVAGCIRRASVVKHHDENGRELTYLEKVARGIIVLEEKTA